jgi:hypothetical protein
MIGIILVVFVIALVAIIKWGIENEKKIAKERRSQMNISPEAMALLGWNEPKKVYCNGFESGIHKNNQHAQLKPFVQAVISGLAIMALSYNFLVAIQ